MKLTVIGGAGIRVPLVVNGLFRPETTLAVSELSLFDTDPRALRNRRPHRAGHGEKSRRNAARSAAPPTLEAALDGASFVVSSIRVGGLAGTCSRRNDRARARPPRSGNGRPRRVRPGHAHHPHPRGLRPQNGRACPRALAHQLHQSGRNHAEALIREGFGRPLYRRLRHSPGAIPAHRRGPGDSAASGVFRTTSA